MSAEDNKAVARRFFEAFDRNKWDVIGDLCADDYVGHLSGAPGPLNFEGHKQFGQMFHAAFPNVSHTIDDQIAEGDRVVTRVTVRGTHSGDLMGLAPSGKPMTMAGVSVFRIGDGKIAEEWTLFDQMGMMQQIGAIPAPAQTQPATP